MIAELAREYGAYAILCGESGVPDGFVFYGGVVRDGFAPPEVLSVDVGLADLVECSLYRPDVRTKLGSEIARRAFRIGADTFAKDAVLPALDVVAISGRGSLSRVLSSQVDEYVPDSHVVLRIPCHGDRCQIPDEAICKFGLRAIQSD